MSNLLFDLRMSLKVKANSAVILPIYAKAILNTLIRIISLGIFMT